MGNFKKVKLYIESTGYMYTTDETNVEGWEDGVLDENQFSLVKIEVVEEYNLSPQQIDYINSEEIDFENETEIEREISAQSRGKKINLILRK